MQNHLIKSAVVGLGIGEQHASAILENQHCLLSKIVELDQYKTHQFIKENKLKNTSYATFEEVINDPSIGLVSIASYDDFHYGQVLECLKKNKHIFVEKPLCQTYDQLKSLHLEWGKTQCALLSNLVLRKSPLYIWLKDMIANQLLGEIYAFDGDYLYGRVHKITDGWRKDIANYSVMRGGGIHIIDLMLWLIAQKPVTVASNKNKIVTKSTDFRYHDFHHSVYTFESGLIGRITANFGCVHKHQHVIRIFGTKGTFIYDDMGARIHWNCDEMKTPELIHYAPKIKQKGRLIHDLVDSILKNEHTNFARREFDLMSVVLASDESLSRFEPLKIEYLTC